MRTHTTITLLSMSVVIVALLFMSYYKNCDCQPIIMTYEEFQRIW